MTDILNIEGEPFFDDRIVKIEVHTYNPYANTTLGHSDEIRIPIQQQDLYTLPCDSFLYIEGKFLTKQEPQATTATKTDVLPNLTNNCVAFMFDEIRYELNGVEIDKCRNVGITSTIKNYVSLSHEKSRTLQYAGWIAPQQQQQTRAGDFNFCVPLDLLLGFCEDFKRVVINARHELILIRARNDSNCILAESADGAEINLLRLQWRMPHIVLNDVKKLSLLRTLESGQYISAGFRSWDLYEFPLLQSTTKHSWAVKAATQLEKPRYVVLALQTGRRNVISMDASKFDQCKLSNVKLYLNSEFYPYDDLNLDFENGKIGLLYDMYIKFQKSYYGYSNNVALFSLTDFLKYCPFAVIDCSRQNEAIKSATVDVRIEFECRENVPPNTTAYCLIIHDRVIEYNPLTNIVRKIV